MQDSCDPTAFVGYTLIDPLGKHPVKITSVIGSGSFAHVYLAETLPLQKDPEEKRKKSFVPAKRAVKRLFKAGLDERQLLLQRQEAEVMKAMDPHPNIIQLLATVEDDECLYLIMEYCELDLYEAITQQGGFPEDVVKEVFAQIADSVIHCHSSGFFHRDLKPENCLISTADYKVKLADFGLATSDTWSTELGCGSVRYMAPECFEPTHNSPDHIPSDKVPPPPPPPLPVPPGTLNGGYSPAANDIWALGVILLNLLFGKNPWFEAHMTDAIFCSFAISNHNILRQQFNLSLEFDAVLRRVFELDPRRRCSVLDLKLMVDSITKFVSPEPIPQMPRPVLRARKQGPSSILGGEGFIIQRGGKLPASFIPESPKRNKILRTQPTLTTLKSISGMSKKVKPDSNSVTAESASFTGTANSNVSESYGGSVDLDDAPFPVMTELREPLNLDGDESFDQDAIRKKMNGHGEKMLEFEESMSVNMSILTTDAMHVPSIITSPTSQLSTPIRDSALPSYNTMKSLESNDGKSGTLAQEKTNDIDDQVFNDSKDSGYDSALNSPMKIKTHAKTMPSLFESEERTSPAVPEKDEPNPPTMIREDSNPYLPPPSNRNPAVTDSRELRHRASFFRLSLASPISWFTPKIARETPVNVSGKGYFFARNSNSNITDAGVGKPSLFTIRRRPSTSFGNQSESELNSGRQSFRIIRKRQSHAVIRHGTPIPEPEGVDRVSLSLEELPNSGLKPRAPRKIASVISLNSFGGNLKDMLGWKKKETGEE